MKLFGWFNRVVKKEIVKDANLRIVDVYYVPSETVLIPDLLIGDIYKTAMIPSICDITFEYDGEEYVISDQKKFYLEHLQNVEFPNDNIFVKHDILIKEYKNGKKEISLYEPYRCNNNF